MPVAAKMTLTALPAQPHCNTIADQHMASRKEGHPERKLSAHEDDFKGSSNAACNDGLVCNMEMTIIVVSMTTIILPLLLHGNFTLSVILPVIIVLSKLPRRCILIKYQKQLVFLSKC